MVIPILCWYCFPYCRAAQMYISKRQNYAHILCTKDLFLWTFFQNLQRFLVSTNFGHCSVLYPWGKKGQLMCCCYSNKQKGGRGGGEEREKGGGDEQGCKGGRSKKSADGMDCVAGLTWGHSWRTSPRQSASVTTTSATSTIQKAHCQVGHISLFLCQAFVFTLFF